MSKDDPNSLGHYHDEGEQDYAEDKGYNQPHGAFGDIFNRDYEHDRNAAYRKGWENAKKQDKG